MEQYGNTMFFIHTGGQEREDPPKPRENSEDPVMTRGKPSKAWEPLSRQVKLPEEDWAVLESVYNNYRFQEGDLQRAEFIKRMITKGITSYLFQLRSRTPEALARIAKASSTLSSPK